jgi:hypothetical protein
MHKILLDMPEFAKHKGLLFNSLGMFSEGVRVDGSIEHPMYLVIFDKLDDIYCFCDLCEINKSRIISLSAY